MQTHENMQERAHMRGQGEKEKKEQRQSGAQKKETRCREPIPVDGPSLPHFSP
jgi:hypothetical protein